MKAIIVLASLAIGALGIPFGVFRTTNINRVIGGRDAEVGEFPYQASIQIKVAKFHLCGGSIISEKVILTAGHCKYNDDVSKYSVKVGMTNLKEKENEHQTLDLKAFIVHPGYTGEDNEMNDIAVIILDGAIKLDGKLTKVISLASKDDYTGQAVLSGWGDTRTGYTNQLQTAKLNLRTYEECAQDLKNLLGSSLDLDPVSNICTGMNPDNEGACFGDSGGPLIQGDELIGVVSWGIAPCGTDGAPTVYTRVSSFKDFIKENAGVEF